jgi:hypothetical protein
MLYKIRGEKRWRVAAGWRIEVAAPNPRGIKKVARWRHFRIFYTPLKRDILAPPATFSLNRLLL